LLCLNETWTAPGGASRVLRSNKSFDDYVREAPPVAGAAFGFKRRDRSWHGHLPFAGERLVVQLTYLESAAAAEHKRRAARFQGLMKKLFERVG
jgi:hypothetical protein